MSPRPPSPAPSLRGPGLVHSLWAGLGAAVALCGLGALAAHTGQPWLMGSFGASCVLLFGFPESPFAQPRNVIGGHGLSSLVGLLGLHWLGDGWPALGLVCAAALVLMLLTRSVHPPAGGNPVIVFMTHAGWGFLWLPTLLGALLLMLWATAYWRVARRLQRAATRP